MQRADLDTLQPSYQQAQHLWAAYFGEQFGRDLPRLMVVGWDIPGVCDVDAMTRVINSHLRRHDTYHSSFEIESGTIIRRTIADPDDIEFVPAPLGVMDEQQIRTRALTATPDTLQWDCFTFGVVQKADHFTFYASVDHLHIDGMSAAVIFLDIHHSYRDLTQQRELAQSTAVGYRDFTRRQHEQAANMTLESPEIREWASFAQDADGNWPSFPLPLGDALASSKGDWITVDLLSSEATEAFDTACRVAGARFSGGVIGCAALAEHQLTGNQIYRGFAPCDTRNPSLDALSAGWFASLFPVTVEIGDAEFPQVARAAQKSFDACKGLANVSLNRMLELAPLEEMGIKPPSVPPMMVSVMDFRKIESNWEGTNLGVYGDNLSMGGINMWINRYSYGTTLTISFPDNAVARASVDRYIAVLTQVFADAANVILDPAGESEQDANSCEHRLDTCMVHVGSRHHRARRPGSHQLVGARDHARDRSTQRRLLTTNLTKTAAGGPASSHSS
jgi:hypothetical protein